MCQLADNFAQLAAGDFDFDKWLALIREHQIYEVGRNSSFPLHPAHYWTGIYRQQDVDFVGKVESFEPDFNVFCKQINIISGERKNTNVTDKLLETHYRYASRMSAASISKINRLFELDFELFGYEKLSS